MVKLKRKNSKGGLRRKSNPAAGLDKKNHPRTRQEFIDYDYVDQLSDEEKIMLSKFTDEYYGASLAKKEDWNSRRKDFHRLQKDRKICRDRNNARLRDIITISKATNTIESIDFRPVENKLSNTGRQEDAVIKLLDLKIKEEKKNT